MGVSSLAIDAGQTGMKVRSTDATGGTTEWSHPGIRTDLPLIPQLADVIADAAARDVRVDAVGVGVSGLTDVDSDAAALLAASVPLGADSLTLAHDSITSYLGALGDELGTVVAAGTGVVTLAVGATEVARIDGWGYIMGDAGSGYWIGREALEAVMRAHDGRGPATALTEAVRADFIDLEHAYIQLQSDPARVSRVASYSRVVADLSAEDAVAAGILTRAGGELAHSAVTGLRRVGEDRADAPRVRAVGGVFRSDRVLESFEAAVRDALPRADVRVDSAHPVDGAARLVTLPEHSALTPMLFRAHRPS